MTRRVTLPFLAITVAASLLCGPAATARTTDTYRPDAWIKLCGLSEGCTINPPPHPWKGNDRYNTTGGGQTVSVKMEDGEGVRFWIAIDNDGSSADTIVVQGCQGNRRFKVNRVVLGKVKRPDAGATKVTRKFLNGTLSFDMPAGSDEHHKFFTLNIIAPTTAEGVTYHCRMTITSEGNDTLTDTVVAVMTTY
jgi:hypothetical protein